MHRYVYINEYACIYTSKYFNICSRMFINVKSFINVFGNTLCKIIQIVLNNNFS